MKTPLNLILVVTLGLVACQNNPSASDQAAGDITKSEDQISIGDFTADYSPSGEFSLERVKEEEEHGVPAKDISQPRATAAKWPHISAYLQSFQRSPQIFTVGAGEKITITGAQGTRVEFDKGVLVTAEGAPLTGPVRIELSEYYQKGDFIRAGLSTATRSQTLESGGMVNLKVYHQGKTCRIAEGRSFEIEFASGDMEDMQLFDGARDEAGEMLWVAQKDSERDENITERISLNAVVNKKELVFLNNFIRSASANFYYPRQAAERNIQGRVDVSFFIDKNGKIRRPQILQSADHLLSQSVIYGLRTLPDLRLEDYDYVPVNKPITLPVAFYYSRDQDISRILPDEATEKAILATRVDKSDRRSRPAAGYGRMIDQPDSALDDFYRKQKKERAMAARAFRSSNLGWINCDRFLDEGETGDMYVRVEDWQSGQCYLIFEDINSVLAGRDLLGEPFFGGVPTGKPVRLLLLQFRKDQLFVAVRHLETAAELELSGFEFEAYSEEEFDQLLRSLNESALSRTET